MFDRRRLRTASFENEDRLQHEHRVNPFMFEQYADTLVRGARIFREYFLERSERAFRIHRLAIGAWTGQDQLELASRPPYDVGQRKFPEQPPAIHRRKIVERRVSFDDVRRLVIREAGELI